MTRRPQFRLRSLFILTAIVAMGCWVLAREKSLIIPALMLAGICLLYASGLFVLAWFSWFISRGRRP
ncbi:MAG TPA: hypothetical protein VND64_04490 [Pirellulales bacterium]|nr:hypothetical protein [Pirellulales bacterium]